MAFRFRRSVRLAPGIRVNFGKRGASLSIGGRGFTTNYSSRGVRHTLGIPGTGLSWSSTSRSGKNAGVRRPSQRQIEAMERRMAKEFAREEAEKKVSKELAEYADLLSIWRELPHVPDIPDYETYLSPQEFTPPDPPEPYKEKETKRRWRSEFKVSERKKTPAFKATMVVAFFGLCALLAGYSSKMEEGLAEGLGILLFMVLTLLIIVRIIWREVSLQRRADVAWPVKWDEFIKEYEEEMAEYAMKVGAMRESWGQLEKERIARLESLLRGDLETVNDSLEDALSGLEFPFETKCEIAAPNEKEAYVMLDLPEIEDVIPVKKKVVLKDGRIKEKNRTKAEQAYDYAILATGLAIYIARAAFAICPTIQDVTIAAYTQRRHSKTGVIEDQFVYEAMLNRKAMAGIEGGSVDPIGVLNNAKSRINLQASHHMKKISAPGWLSEFR